MKKGWLMTIGAAFLLAACGGSDDAIPDEPQPQDEERTKVNIATRAEEETTAAESLQAGLFMVNYVDGRSDDLLADHNYVNNQLLTWTGSAWMTDMPIYWNDMETKADFYAYAPYQEQVSDARQMTFSVQTDQRTDEAFAKSDLLWGCIKGQSPTTESFDLTLTHQLSRLTVAVTAETGFDEGELQAKDVAVTIGGTKVGSLVDLATGTVSVLSGSAAEDIVCHSNGDLTYTAVLIPQDVPFSNLIQVDWQGNKYTLQNSFRLDPKRQYTLTVKLKKTKSGFDIGIEGWDILPEDFGGTIGG